MPKSLWTSRVLKMLPSKNNLTTSCLNMIFHKLYNCLISSNNWNWECTCLSFKLQMQETMQVLIRWVNKFHQTLKAYGSANTEASGAKGMDQDTNLIDLQANNAYMQRFRPITAQVMFWHGRWHIMVLRNHICSLKWSGSEFGTFKKSK